MIRRIQAGKHDACAQLIAEHYGRIYQLLARLTRDAHAAEDLCQETFAIAWKRIASFDQRCALGTWLHQIAYRRFVDFSRRRRPGEIEFRDRQIPHAIDRLVMDEQQAALHAALANLDEPFRDVLVVHYLHGLTLAQTAAVLQENPSTVRWRAREGLTRLREILFASGYERNREQPHSAAARAARAGDSAGA